MEKREIVEIIRDNWDEVLAASLENCHARGLHSVVLKNKNGRLTRLFYASQSHDLWKNEIGSEGDDTVDRPFYKMSVAIHPHHCDLTLTVIDGFIINDRFKTGSGYTYSQFEYVSPIKGQPGQFSLISEAEMLLLVDSHPLWPGNSLSMKASELHTVYAPKGNRAAWLIEEADEDPNYRAVCYSNADLTKFDFNGMYQPMRSETLSQVVNYLIA